MTGWEYTTIQVETSLLDEGLLDTQDLDARLNELGAKGWELVAAFDTNRAGGRSQSVFAVLKRPRER